MLSSILNVTHQLDIARYTARPQRYQHLRSLIVAAVTKIVQLCSSVLVMDANFSSHSLEQFDANLDVCTKCRTYDYRLCLSPDVSQWLLSFKFILIVDIFKHNRVSHCLKHI